MDGYVSAGVSWRAADLRTLERLAVSGEARGALQQAAFAAGCSEALVLSTCSRIELHVVHDGPMDTECLLELLTEPLTREGARSRGVATARRGEDAVMHLFRVASGLESRAAGEVEIQAQLRAAARQAAAEHGEPHRLRHLVAAALLAAQAGPPAALEERRGLLARRAVTRALTWADDRPSLEAVVVGAGTMGRQVYDALPTDRCTRLLLSRSHGLSAQGRVEVRPLEQLPERLLTADLVFVATSAGRQILSRPLVRRAVRDRVRPLAVIDLSVPRNVDPSVAQEPGVALLDLDDLGASEPGAAAEGGDLAAAERAAAEAAQTYLGELRTRRAGPLITELRTRLEAICLDRLRDSLRGAPGATLTDEALEHTAHAIAGAVAHPPTMLLRTAAGQSDESLLALLTDAFDLRTATDPA